MTVDELKQVAKRYYPELRSNSRLRTKNPDQPVEILLERGERRLQRSSIHIPALTSANPLQPGFRFILWLADLHDNLLHGKAGLRWNAGGAIFTILLCLTGAVIWWPGIRNWRSSLTVRRRQNPRGLNWALHSALGFWSLAFHFYVGNQRALTFRSPESFNAVVDFLEPMRDSSKTTRFGDQVLFWLSRLHFGRFAAFRSRLFDDFRTRARSAFRNWSSNCGGNAFCAPGRGLYSEPARLRMPRRLVKQV